MAFHKIRKRLPEMIKEIIKRVAEKLIVVIISIFLYVPIIVGILSPMLIFFLLDLYISWSLIGNPQWMWDYYLIPSHSLTLVISIEALLFCFGFGLLLSGLITLVKGKIKGVGLVRTGIYKYIRHPQNLSIVLMVLPFALYVPGFKDIGIRMGEIASWLYFAFFMCLYSFYEEWRLVKKYGNGYLEYYRKTGHFIPKIKREKTEPSPKINFLKKILITVLLYLFFYFLFDLIIRLFFNLTIYL